MWEASGGLFVILVIVFLVGSLSGPKRHRVASKEENEILAKLDKNTSGQRGLAFNALAEDALETYAASGRQPSSSVPAPSEEAGQKVASVKTRNIAAKRN
jgi:hypothetical protein